MPGPLDNSGVGGSDTLSPRREAASRARLIEAIVEVAGANGYVQTTVSEVIARAGASRSTFYEQFEDIGECLIAALERTGEKVLDEVRLGLLANPSQDPARSAVGTLVRFAEEERERGRLLWVESLGAGARALAVRDGVIDGVVDLIEATRAEREREEGEVLDVPVLGLVGGVARLLSMRLPRGEAAIHGLAEDLDEWVRSYALAPPEARDGAPTPDGAPPTLDGRGPSRAHRARWRRGSPLGDPALREVPAVADRRKYPPLPRGRHGLRQTEIARSQRERITYALARESYEKGYEGVSVNDIVKAAGVARKVFYEQFADKQQAGVAALQQTFEHALAATAGHFFAGDSWPERIWRMGGALTEHYYSNPVEAHLSFVELHAIGGAGVSLAHERLATFTLLLEEGYRYRPPTSPLPRTVSDALVATVLELGYRQAPRAGLDLYPVLLGQQTYMCLAPFIGAREATKLVEGWLSAASE